MDKLQSNRGFTLIEVVFTFSIICILSTILMFSSWQNKVTLSLSNQYHLIQSVLQEARTYAITNHQKVDITMTSNSIGYRLDGQQRIIELNEGYVIKNIKNLYFNKNGTINQGNHISLCNQNDCYKIIFNLGSGDFYLQQ